MPQSPDLPKEIDDAIKRFEEAVQFRGQEIGRGYTPPFKENYSGQRIDATRAALRTIMAAAIAAERKRWEEAEPMFTMCEACGSHLNEKTGCDCTKAGLDCQRIVGLVPRPIPPAIAAQRGE
jgi:hypothetical protein